MEEKVNFTLVGIFVLLLGAGLIGGVLWFSSAKSYLKAYDIYQTYMTESVSGLNINAPVRYRGVQVGRVQKIALNPKNVEQVQLTLNIERGTQIKADTKAILRSQGLTGLAFIELAGGSQDSPLLTVAANEPYPIITAGPPLANRLEATVLALLTNLNQTSDHVNRLMDTDNQRMLKNTLVDIALLSRTLAARSASIDASLDSAARTLDNTAKLSQELPALARRIQHSADAFDQMVAEFTRAGVSARYTLENGQQFTAETLPEIQQTVSELRDLGRSLRRISGELEQDPSVLLYGKPAVQRGPGE
jgi:phospholipid/cholesterol/gamma-HCH transport system substrate-binding protein